MNIETTFIMDGEVFSKHGKNPLYNVPNVGDKILYKNFRSNENMKVEIKDTILSVKKISYEVEEDWNNTYKRKVFIHVVEVKG